MKPPDAAPGSGLTPAEKSFLLDLARRTVAAAVQGRTPPEPSEVAAETGVSLGSGLAELRGAFVTLHLGGRLRGCIGTIVGRQSLVEAVVGNACRAALHDPRFAPVSAAELADLEVEVSALSPLRAVDSPGRIEIGRHGILLAKRGRQAVFLPQVAPEQGWDLATTLTQLCLKAGLASDDWREGAELRVFEAEVF